MDIKSNRILHHWTQCELAKRARVSQSSVNKVEHGYSVGQDIMEKILHALGAPVEPVQETAHIDLKVERERKNLSQRQLAALSGLSENTISNIERGYTHPTPYTLDCLYKALGMAAEGQGENSSSVQKADSKKIPDQIGDTVTNGDVLRRRILSNADLIRAGCVPCAADRSQCDGVYGVCKNHWLNRPYTGKE